MIHVSLSMAPSRAATLAGLSARASLPAREDAASATASLMTPLRRSAATVPPSSMPAALSRSSFAPATVGAVR